MIVSAAVIIIYTASGGFLAASTTDFIQSIIMTIALIVIVCFGVSNAGGFDAVSAYATSLPGYISVTSMHDAASGRRSILRRGHHHHLYAGLGPGYFGMPHILLRFMAIEKPEKIKLSRRVATIWVFIAMAVAIFIGVIALCLSHVGIIGTLEDPERAIIVIAQFLAQFGIVPALLAGLVMAGILACTMSTCDSQLLAASSSISENILHGVFNLNISKKMTMVMARVTLVVIAIIAIFIARDPNSSVFQIVSFSWAGFGGRLWTGGPVRPVLEALQPLGRSGRYVGRRRQPIFIWKFLVKPMGGVFGIYELLPGFLVGLILTVVVSLATALPMQKSWKNTTK